MNLSPSDFASLLCSRLCHDLLSPVGALNNGLELLADEHDPDMRARCLELLADMFNVAELIAPWRSRRRFCRRRRSAPAVLLTQPALVPLESVSRY